MFLRRAVAWGASVLLAVTTARVVAAQATALIPEGRLCSSCTLQAERLGVLPSGAQPGAVLTMPTGVRRDSQGRLWVFSNGQTARVYSPDGTFLRQIGRLGGGPGEFTMPIDVAGLPGDSVLVMDASPRASVFDSDLRFVRQVQMPAAAYGPIAIAWPRIVVNSDVLTGASAGYPLHLLDMSVSPARLLRSFGPGHGELRFGLDAVHQQVSSRLDTATIVSSSVTIYRLHMWSATGNLIKTIERRPSWLRDSLRLGLGSPRVAPASMILAIQRASDSTVWVASRVPAPTWRNAWVDAPVGARELSASQIDYAALFRTRIDLVDVRRARLIATADFDGVIVGVLHGDIFAFYRNVGDDSRIVVERVALSRRR